MKELFLFIYCQPLRRILLWIFLLILFWGCLGHRERNSLRWRVWNFILFLGATAAVFYMTVYTRGESPSEAVLIPFQSFQEAKNQPELYRSMLMNVFLFVPIGLTLPFALGGRKISVWITIVAALTFSAGIEYLQYRYALGRCEMDDIIMNTLGASIGCMSHSLCRNWEICVLSKLQFLKKILRPIMEKRP